jgi:outer membrane biosynthesis protein TonB
VVGRWWQTRTQRRYTENMSISRMKDDATRAREKTNEWKTIRRRGRTYPIRAASRHAGTTFVTVSVGYRYA